ncbi:MAG: VanZ family protein [Terriglobales bacterium]
MSEKEDRLSPARPSLVRAWWPAMVWIGLISIESSDAFSSQNTGSILYGLLTRLFGEINVYEFLVFHFYLRKTGHVIGYGMLALLLLRGWRMTVGPARAWLLRMLLLSWIGTAFVASMDEWHQSFIPSRTGAVRDVILDSIAGLVFLLIAYLWLRRSARAEQAV